MAMKYVKLAEKILQSGQNDAYFTRYSRPMLDDEREIAIQQAKILGFDVDYENDPDEHWDGKTLSVKAQDGGWTGRDHPSNILHEVAHWAVCTSLKRRSSPDYGLGSGPDSVPGLPRMMGDVAIQLEEERASMLGILMEFELGFPAADTLRLHQWAHPWSPHDGNKPQIVAPDGTWTYDRARGWTRAVNWLVKKNLVRADGTVIWGQVRRGVADT